MNRFHIELLCLLCQNLTQSRTRRDADRLELFDHELEQSPHGFEDTRAPQAALASARHTHKKRQCLCACDSNPRAYVATLVGREIV